LCVCVWMCVCVGGCVGRQRARMPSRHTLTLSFARCLSARPTASDPSAAPRTHGPTAPRAQWPGPRTIHAYNTPHRRDQGRRPDALAEPGQLRRLTVCIILKPRARLVLTAAGHHVPLAVPLRHFIACRCLRCRRRLIQCGRDKYPLRRCRARGCIAPSCGSGLTLCAARPGHGSSSVSNTHACTEV
jgi:hypothetical protein